MAKISPIKQYRPNKLAAMLINHPTMGIQLNQDTTTPAILGAITYKMMEIIREFVLTAFVLKGKNFFKSILPTPYFCLYPLYSQQKALSNTMERQAVLV